MTRQGRRRDHVAGFSLLVFLVVHSEQESWAEMARTLLVIQFLPVEPLYSSASCFTYHEDWYEGWGQSAHHELTAALMPPR